MPRRRIFVEADHTIDKLEEKIVEKLNLFSVTSMK